MKKLIYTFVVVMLTAMLTNLQAQSNSQLSIQGVLRNANGTAVENGQYDIVFRLWDAPTNGTKVWEEEILQVDVEGGIYSVVLGQAATLLDASFTEQYFLGVSVEGGTELIPRAPLTSSPYALSLIGSDNVFPNSGNVGVGSSAPQNKVTIQRGDGILGLEAIEDANNTSTITTTAEGISFDAGGTDKIYAFPNGRIQATANEKLTIATTSGNAIVGYETSTGDDLQLSNPVGGITLNPTTNPVEINKDGEAIKLIGTDSSFISFYPQGTSAAMNAKVGYNDSDNPEKFGITTNGGDMIINNQNGKLTIYNGMEVGKYGEPGWIYWDFPNGHSYMHPDNAGAYTSSPFNNTPGSIISHAGVFASVFRAWSDKRIKKDIQVSDRQKDLNTLKQIEVTDYRHVDEIKKGRDFRKGLIAQQVKSIFPEAVSMTTRYIPNVYAFSSKVISNENQFTITLESPHALKQNDNVMIIVSGAEENMIVQDIVDDFSFTVSPKEIKIDEKVFVYGKEVDDFHSVDYDRVFTLNVSATQELARKVEALEKENAQLKSNAVKTNDILKSLSAKVDALQQNLEMTGQK